MKKFVVFMMMFCCTMVVAVASGAEKNIVDELADDDLQVRQLPGSEESCREFFSCKTYASDTIYAIIDPTGNCPRCDGALTDLDYKIKKARPGASTVLVSVYPDSLAAQAYNITWNIVADYYMYDTEKKVLDFLSFDMGYLHVPYLLKLIPATGEIIIGVEVSDDTFEFIRAFCNYATPKEKMQHARMDSFMPKYTMSGYNAMKRVAEYRITVPDSIKISEIDNTPALNGSHFAFTDKLRMLTEVMSIDEEDKMLNFRYEVVCDSNEKRTFVEVSDLHFKSMNDLLRYMPLSPLWVNDSMMYISYSLPNIWYVEEPNHIGYRNETALLGVNTINGTHTGIVGLVVHDDADYFTAHFTQFPYFEKIAMPCQRVTWPMSTDIEDYKNIEEKDPFKDSFYTYKQPLFAIVDPATGVMEQRISDLPEIARTTRTGYAFIVPVIDTYGEEGVITDGVSGEIWLISESTGDSILRTYKAFDIDMTQIADPDTTLFYTYDCTVPYDNVLCRHVASVKISDKKIHCIVRYGKHGAENVTTDGYCYVEIDRKSGKRKERAFPKDGASTPLSYSLWRDSSGDVKPCVVSRTPDGWVLRTFKL